MALSMMGAVVAQLFRLYNGPSPPGTIGFYEVAVGLACVCQCAALVIVVAGAHRFWRQQSAMARGEALSAGWEVWLIFCCVAFVSSHADPSRASSKSWVHS